MEKVIAKGAQSRFSSPTNSERENNETSMSMDLEQPATDL